MILFANDAGFKRGICRRCTGKHIVRLHYWGEGDCEGWICVTCIGRRPQFQALDHDAKIALILSWREPTKLIQWREHGVEKMIDRAFTFAEQFELELRLLRGSA
jgi:hypothetical protein